MDMLARNAYSSDLTDAQFTILEPLIPEIERGGRPRKVNNIHLMLRRLAPQSRPEFHYRAAA